MTSHRATFYVQIEPTWATNDTVYSIDAVRLTKGRPYRPVPGTALVRLAIQVPDSVFEAFAPPVIVVPESMVVAEALTAEVADANEDGSDA